MSFALVAQRMEAFDLPISEQQALRDAHQGSFLRLPEIPAIPIARSVLPGPLLLFSDMPEYIGAANGVTMEESLSPGRYRLYIYHVPGTTNSERAISAVIENLSQLPLEVRFTRYASPKPGTDYPMIGLDALMEYFTGKALPHAFTVPPQGRSVLDPKLEATTARDPQLIHALYEFEIDQSARISVLQRDPSQSSTNVLDNLPRLPRQLPEQRLSGAGRGIFPDADFLITNAPGSIIDTANGLQRLVLADGFRDGWVTGTDGLTSGATVTNKGSYGVIYHVRLAYISPDGRALALLVGGPGRNGGGRPMAVLRINDGKWKGGWLKIAGPHERGEVSVAQEWPAAEQGQTNYLELIYSPPGGSSLPTPLYLAPFSLGRDAPKNTPPP
jgi:hypothetical protein